MSLVPAFLGQSSFIHRGIEPRASAARLGFILSLGAHSSFSAETAPFDFSASWTLSAIPMFLLMAEFVLRSGIADDLFRAAAAWCGRVPGGLGATEAMLDAAMAIGRGDASPIGWWPSS